MKDKDIRNTCLSIIQKLENDESYQEYAKKFENDELKYFKKRFEDNSFKLAVIGEFSSGKSTFINAIIHKDLLAHGKRETTATLTYLINVPKDDKRLNTSIVYFNNKEPQKFNNLNDLKEYTTVNDKRQVVGEIEKVEVFLNFADNKKDFIIIDSPGLNGVAQGHFEKTLEIIKSADACVYIIPLQGIKESDINYLRLISKYQNNFIFVHNFIDELRESQGEDKETKVRAQEERLDNLVFKNNEYVRYRICGVSSLKELVYFDNSIKRLYANDTEDLTDEQRNKLHKQSYFDDYYKIIKDDYSDSKLDIIKYGSSAFALKDYLKYLLEQCTLYKEKIRETKEYKNKNKSKEAVEEDINRLENSRPKLKKQLENMIVSNLKTAEEDCLEFLLKNYNEIIKDEERIICKSTNIEECEKLYETLCEEINLRFKEQNKLSNELFKAYLTGLYWKIKNEIDKIRGVPSDIFSLNTNVDIFTKDTEKEKFNYDKHYQDYLQNKINDTNKKIEKIKKDNLLNNNNKKYNDEEIEILSKSLDDLEKNEEKQITDLGSRPSAIQKRIFVGTSEVKREGICGWLMDTFFGVEKKDIFETYYDDENGKKWDYKYNEIKNNNHQRQKEIKNRIEELNDKAIYYKKKIASNENKKDELSVELEKAQNELKLAKEDEENNRKKIQIEYLINMKDELKSKINDYKDKCYKALKKEMQKRITNNICENIKDKAFKIFNDSLDKYIEILKIDEQKANNEINELIGIYEKLVDVLNNSIKRIGELYYE